jgi:23S rRNA pseudouridine1911/1915/1917 synthase
MKLYEDERLLVWNKKAGIPVFPLHKDQDGPCVLYEIQKVAPYLQNIQVEGFECGIAHRLDIPTSGAIYIAKNISYFQQLRNLFSTKQLVKRYQFLSSEPKRKAVSCAFSIGHHPKNKRKMIVQKNKTYRCRGKWYPAFTDFIYVAQRQKRCLYTATMKSGVMHQIRVHAAFCGLSLDGDSLYGSKERSVLDSGFALHHLGIEHEELPHIKASMPQNWPDWTK